MTSEELLNEPIGEFLCETVDVSEYDTIHIDASRYHDGYVTIRVVS